MQESRWSLRMLRSRGMLGSGLLALVLASAVSCSSGKLGGKNTSGDGDQLGGDGDCTPCGNGAVSSGCCCGGTPQTTGYCCDNQASTGPCAASCGTGPVATRCLCGGIELLSGNCCGDVPSVEACSSSASCSTGPVNTPCLCGGTAVTSGYCCDGEPSTQACTLQDCEHGLVTAPCMCGTATVDSGYCCAGSPQSSACSVPSCGSGAVTVQCQCGSSVVDSGYCCNGTPQSSACTVPACESGAVTSQCTCGSSVVSGGYCCSGVPSSSGCLASCSAGAVTSACLCGSTQVTSGYCCGGQASTQACCAFGSVLAPCQCGSTPVTGGYCCDSEPSADPCTPVSDCTTEVITKRCLCGGTLVNTEYCCGGVPQTTTCDSGGGTTYYIDPSAATNGTGTLASPYKSWSSVTFAAGNSYLQKRGTTHEGRVNLTASGSKGAWITLGAYGTGERPVLHGTDSDAIRVVGANYVHIRDLHLVTEYVSGGQGMHGVNWYSDPRSTDVVIENCETGPTAGAGFLLHDINNVWVRNNTMHDGASAELGESADNIHFDNCHAYVCEKNISYDNYEGSTYDSSDSGTEYVTGEDYNEGVFRYNIAHGRTQAAHFKISGKHAKSYVGLHHNIVYDWDNNYAFTLQEYTNGYMIGNVVYNHMAAFMIDTGGTSIVVANNIAHSVYAAILMGADGVTPPTFCDYNIFYNCDRIANDWGTGTVYTGLANWQAGFGGAYDQHSSTADPKFVDLTAKDFRLQAGSPAIDTGYVFDDPEVQFALSPDSSLPLEQADFGAGWEIGAYLYAP